MKLFLIFLAAILFAGHVHVNARTERIAAATASDVAAEEPMPERFMFVTAENGQEWIEQCEWPAHKSDSMTRIAACLSFLQGARAIASKRSARPTCPIEFANQSRGTLLTTTYQIARRYPRLPIHRIFRIAFDSIEPGSC